MFGFHCGFGQRTFQRVGAAVVLSLAAATPLHAQPRVAIVAAAATSLTDPRFTDPQAKIAATGLFSAVDVISVTSPNPTPTLAELLQYDAIIVWSNNAFTDRVAMGNVLADYVDAGGGVVLAVFVVNSTTSGLQGRWLTENYAIFVPGSGNATTNATLGRSRFPGTRSWMESRRSRARPAPPPTHGQTPPR